MWTLVIVLFVLSANVVSFLWYAAAESFERIAFCGVTSVFASFASVATASFMAVI